MHVGTQVLEVSTLFIVVKVEVGGWGGVRLPTACGLPFFASIVLVLRTLEVVRRWATKQQAYTNQACLIPTRPFRPRETTTIRSPLSFPPRTLPEPSPNPPPPHTRLSYLAHRGILSQFLPHVLHVPLIPRAHEPVSVADFVRLVRALIQEDAGHPPPVPVLRCRGCATTKGQVHPEVRRIVRKEEARARSTKERTNEKKKEKEPKRTLPRETRWSEAKKPNQTKIRATVTAVTARREPGHQPARGRPTRAPMQQSRRAPVETNQPSLSPSPAPPPPLSL